MQKKKDPESKRRWMILNKSTGKPMLGGDEGVSTEAKANRLSDSYMIPTEVCLHHEYYNLPDPDAEDNNG